jgi:hypothetical protein
MEGARKYKKYEKYFINFSRSVQRIVNKIYLE